jgi:hypothetical protein
MFCTVFIICFDIFFYFSDALKNIFFNYSLIISVLIKETKCNANYGS